MTTKDADAIGVLVIFGFIVTMCAAWLTHVIYCLTTAKYVLLLAGGIIAPIGVIHGLGIWFGSGW